MRMRRGGDDLRRAWNAVEAAYVRGEVVSGTAHGIMARSISSLVIHNTRLEKCSWLVGRVRNKVNAYAMTQSSPTRESTIGIVLLPSSQGARGRLGIFALPYPLGMPNDTGRLSGRVERPSFCTKDGNVWRCCPLADQGSQTRQRLEG